jgi:flagellar L-ring protein precursor FlgH
MTNTTRILAACAAAVLAGAGASACRAGSLWAKGSGRTRALFTDDTARQVGDVLTVVIEEKSVIENETSRSRDKTTSRTGKMDGTLDVANVMFPVGEHIFDFPKMDFSSSSKTQFDGEADYDTDRSFSDEIPVVIEDVQPNGNLVLVGRRTRTVAGDTQVIEISGVVRPSDVTFSNTVKSTNVADFRIVHRTVGQDNGFVDPGWLGRFYNFINPY